MLKYQSIQVRLVTMTTRNKKAKRENSGHPKLGSLASQKQGSMAASVQMLNTYDEAPMSNAGNGGKAYECANCST